MTAAVIIEMLTFVLGVAIVGAVAVGVAVFLMLLVGIGADIAEWRENKHT